MSITDFIINELKLIIDYIDRFPTQRELAIIDKRKDDKFKLVRKINQNGGINHFRELMGFPLVRQPWNEERANKELNVIIDKIGHFPTMNELLTNGSLRTYIGTHGGLNPFREKLGYEAVNTDNKMSSYLSKRGKNSERIVKELLTKWCYAHNLPQPDFNVKLSKGNVIEFVCESNLRIGIDVTNTKTKTGGVIQNKWKHKEYHLYLDELWIVVFSNVFTDFDYIKFNNQSPENVKVMSIETFMEELQISVDKNLQLKIENYNTCDFHSKDNFINLNKGLLSKFFKIKN